MTHPQPARKPRYWRRSIPGRLDPRRHRVHHPRPADPPARHNAAGRRSARRSFSAPQPVTKRPGYSSK